MLAANVVLQVKERPHRPYHALHRMDCTTIIRCEGCVLPRRPCTRRALSQSAREPAPALYSRICADFRGRKARGCGAGLELAS